MSSSSNTEYETRLLSALSEQPEHDGRLWVAYWGAPDHRDDLPAGVPRNIDHIARNLRSAERSRVVLVHGRYGTGKSSFLECLKEQLERGADNVSAPEPATLWLHMPVVTSRINSSALAAVIAAIAEELKGLKPPGNRSDITGIDEAVEDLWRIEAGGLRVDCENECDRVVPPEPSRMAGSASGDANRHRRANTLENELDQSLVDAERFLVVFLDDLDRCERRVAMDTVRLLLRFGSARRIHFVLACDWDVLEQGVKDWMHKHGKADDGEPLVTANSALGKYIHFPVELPTMGSLARSPNEALADEVVKWLVDRVVDRADHDALGKYAKPMLADVLVAGLLNEILRNGDDEQPK